MNYTMISHSFMYTCIYSHLQIHQIPCLTYKLLYIHIYSHTYNTYSHATTKCIYRQTCAYIFHMHISYIYIHILYIIIQPHVKIRDIETDLQKWMYQKNSLPSFFKNKTCDQVPSFSSRFVDAATSPRPEPPEPPEALEPPEAPPSPPTSSRSEAVREAMKMMRVLREFAQEHPEPEVHEIVSWFLMNDGFIHICYFQAETLQKMIQFWRIFFELGWNHQLVLIRFWWIRSW